ncbi:unnamed protein product [Spirodela intermedia]|uniref:Uncharacterized protein n=1 Tax=Spirodela intermedia TaxID=51605 RepID=A0A7I8KPV2_SPIIN|nr:unnamed protein product [Spirodela intermedia]
MRWNELRYSRRGLPQGTMGWPVVGDTIEFLRRVRSLFTSHLLGSPTVMSMDLEVKRGILMNEARGLVPGYRQAMTELLGEWNVVAGKMLSVIGPVAVRERLFPTLDEFIGSRLCSWGGDGATMDVQEKAREMIFSSALKLISGIETGETAAELKAEFFKLARKTITSLLRDLIEERRSPFAPNGGGDILSLLLREEEEGEEEQEVHRTRPNLTDDQMIDLLIAIMYTGFETVSGTVSMAVNYLHDHPSAFQELWEYSEIRQRKSSPDEALTWGEYTSISFTRAVILETMRLATIINGLMRKTTEDIPINGFVVPKGWKIQVYIRESNYDSVRYPAPLFFDPWRWKDRSLENHQHFMVFGCGGRLCPGKELSLEAEGDEIVYFPRVEAPRGLHIRVWTN